MPLPGIARTRPLHTFLISNRPFRNQGTLIRVEIRVTHNYTHAHTINHQQKTEIEWWDRNQNEPYLIIFGAQQKPQQVFWVVDQEILCEINCFCNHFSFLFDICYTNGLTNVFTFIEHVLFIINHSKLFFSKQFHFISPITSYIIVFLYLSIIIIILLMFIIPLLMVCLTHQLECVKHQKYRCASYTSNGVLAGTNVAHHIWCVGHTLFFTVYNAPTLICSLYHYWKTSVYLYTL